MAGKSQIISISLPEKIAKQVDRAAKELSMNRSEYIRSVLRHKMAFEGIREMQKEFQRGNYPDMTEEEVVQAVREIRSEIH